MILIGQRFRLLHRLLLTFDVEDFINERSFEALHVIIELLKKYDLRALFFVTGHMAERLKLLPIIQRSLGIHEIGFHSSAHSVHPTIFEYCDIEEYDNAYSMSLRRETSRINPISGEIEGAGGLQTLKSLFSSNNIQAYRAPGFCCPPPNLEAMATLGLKHDFSWNLSRVPVAFRDVTFYPRPVFRDCETALLVGKPKVTCWGRFLRSVFMERTTVLNFHPSILVNKDHWDSLYHKGNPQELRRASPRSISQIRTMYANLERLLSLISKLRKLRIVDSSPDLSTSRTHLNTDDIDIDQVASGLASWPRTFFAYEPKYLKSQIYRFLNP